MLEQLISYAIVVTVLAMVPGADMMIIMKNTLALNRFAGRITLGGIMAGHLFWLVISVVGLAVIIAGSPLLFNAIKYAGALYLIYVGVQSMRAGVLVPRQSLEHFDTLSAPVSRKSLNQSFRQGLVANLLNPKVLILYMTIIPQFVGGDVETGLGYSQQIILLALILVAISIIWFLMVVELVNLLKRWMKSYVLQNWFSKGAGLIIILFGLRTLFFG
ncbi:LysE family translocator [Lacicoccus alkaliphilus]|uniref:Resistance to homoserine/threonine (RhtB) family protein n=1 Tax=Lacicoccus alkaliphilus DSM 16010 TaxID=1123231 RepID=A0A1M7IIN8_9BACL|nr:LysE family translocator [Salinicoccus alkaliphilus]SHM40686.1 resistance to homoserine/threonine (RhtB) family protein [Salinicoccus alkaliphilus DSM 16010]